MHAFNHLWPGLFWKFGPVWPEHSQHQLQTTYPVTLASGFVGPSAAVQQTMAVQPAATKGCCVLLQGRNQTRHPPSGPLPPLLAPLSQAHRNSSPLPMVSNALRCSATLLWHNCKRCFPCAPGFCCHFSEPHFTSCFSMRLREHLGAKSVSSTCF